MDINALLQFMGVAEKLKCNTRHSWTSNGRHESVAEHTYRMCVFAWLVRDEFPELDMNRVMELCLFHDIGEAVTGDIACFLKGEADEKKEQEALEDIAKILPEPQQQEMKDIFQEIQDNATPEAKLFQALDKMEAVIQHNEASIDTWLPLEYELQLTYGQDRTKEFAYTQKIRDVIYQNSLDKIKEEGQ